MAAHWIDPVVRFRAKVAKNGPVPDHRPDLGACWVWTAGRQANGRYGAFSVATDRQTGAHRFAYELDVGTIPEGMQIDHLCRNTLCVNPRHLEAVTPQVNVKRSTLGIKERSKTACPQGHPYDETNTKWTPQGHRQCRACNKRRSVERTAARRAALLSAR